MREKKDGLEPWKKAVIALSAGSAGFFCLGSWLNTASVEDSIGQQGRSAFTEFLSQTQHQSVSAFGASSLKQIAVDSIHDLALFLDSKKVKAGSFSTDPQAYANWVMAHTDGSRIKVVDFSLKSNQDALLDELATAIAVNREANLDFITSSDLSEMKKTLFRGGSENSSNLKWDFNRWLKAELKEALKDSTLLGYSLVDYGDGSLGIELHELALGEKSTGRPLNPLSEGVVATDARFDGLLDKMGSHEGLYFSSAEYSRRGIEQFSTLGSKGWNTYKNLVWLSTQGAGSLTNEALDDPATLFLMSMPDRDYRLLALGDSVIDPRIMQSFSVFQAMNPEILTATGQQISASDLVERAHIYAQAGFQSNADLSVAMKNYALFNSLKKTYSEPQSASFINALDSPCANGLGATMAGLIENPALSHAMDCAYQYGLTVPQGWVDDMMHSQSFSELRYGSVLLGFHNDVAVFAVNDKGEGAAYASSMLKENKPGSESVYWDSDYDSSFVVVNPASDLFSGLSGQQKDLMARFVLLHEMFHVNEQRALNGQQANVLNTSRSTAEESNADVFAAKNLLNQGYFPESILQVHRKFCENIGATAEDLDVKLSNTEHAKLKNTIWFDKSLVSESAVKSMAGSMSTYADHSKPANVKSPDFTPPRLTDTILASNRMEAMVRHAEVKKLISDYRSIEHMNSLDLAEESKDTFLPPAYEKHNR